MTWTLLVALALVLPGFLLWREFHDTASDSPPQDAPAASAGTLPSLPSASAPASDPASSSAQPAATISLQSANSAVHPHQTVRLTGRVREGGQGVRLQVQQLVGARWLNFPLPVMSDDGGKFTAYVELSQPGRIILRVLRPDTGLSSNVVVVRVEPEQPVI